MDQPVKQNRQTCCHTHLIWMFSIVITVSLCIHAVTLINLYTAQQSIHSIRLEIRELVAKGDGSISNHNNPVQHQDIQNRRLVRSVGQTPKGNNNLQPDQNNSNIVEINEKENETYSPHVQDPNSKDQTFIIKNILDPKRSRRNLQNAIQRSKRRAQVKQKPATSKKVHKKKQSKEMKKIIKICTKKVTAKMKNMEKKKPLLPRQMSPAYFTAVAEEESGFGMVSLRPTVDEPFNFWRLNASNTSVLLPQGGRVIILQGGLYMVYAQVLFNSGRDNNVFIIRKEATNELYTDLAKCITTDRVNLSHPMAPSSTNYNTCNTMAITVLKHGDSLHISTPESNQEIIPGKTSTYWWAVRLGEG